MEYVKEHQDLMKSVVKNYRGCGHKEYYGMLVMRDGLSYCRQCIYEIWMAEGLAAATHRADVQAAKYGGEPNYDNLQYWKPDPAKDLCFPYYEDGVNYFE